MSADVIKSSVVRPFLVLAARKTELRGLFRECQKQFDKVYRNKERQVRRGIMLDIDNCCTTNPTEFWNMLNNLGPKSKAKIPEEVYNDNGDVLTDPESVRRKWKVDFEDLYSTGNETPAFDKEFLSDMKQRVFSMEQTMLDPLYMSNASLNSNFTYDEAEKVIRNAKNKRSLGIDGIPYEVLKFAPVIKTLQHFFQLCFGSGKIPCICRKAIICPIPKSKDNDPRIPFTIQE